MPYQNQAHSQPDTERWLILPAMWNLADNRQASREGWYINCSPVAGATRICACDAPVTFDGYDHRSPEYNAFVTDLQASEWVIERMHQGSSFHERAWLATVKAQMQGAYE